MKIFISYLTIEKSLAGDIKDTFDAYGFESFLAHEDIQPTQIWMDSIINALQKSDIVLPIITKGFSDSVWCNQEIGIGLALDKLIIPIKIDQDPSGFLSKYQALNYHRNTKFPLDKIIQVISEDTKYGKSFKDFLIEKLEKSQSFEEAKNNATNIVEILDFTTPQLQRIMEVSLNNDQISSGFAARRKIRRFISKYKDQLEVSLYDKFNEEMPY